VAARVRAARGSDAVKPDPERDRRMLAAVARGDRAAFEALYAAYQPRIYGYLFRMLGRADVADELASDVMVEVWKQAGRFKGESKVSTWMFGIARFKALTAIRQRRTDTVPVEDAGPLVDPAESPDRAVERHRLRAGILRAMSGLSHDHREVVELTFFQGLSYPEIADLIGCPVNTVKTRMFHARRQLGAHLSAEGVS
jgi:RNA polymerase sigma-70 factor (ECF subfamily)